MRHVPPVLLLAVLTACAGDPTSPSGDEVLFDFELPALVLPGHTVKDHTVVRTADRFHVFGIHNRLGDDGVPVERARSFFHATSPDLRRWTFHEPVVPIAPGWREQFVWAPHVVAVDGGYRMYFTGVDAQGTQVTGVAHSSDLSTWTVAPEPIHHPDPEWADWKAGHPSDGRDPMVLRHDGRWWMFFAASARDVGGPKGAVGWATSEDGLLWRDHGALLVSPRPAVLESPFVVPHNGAWHMFVSPNDRPSLRHHASPTLDTDWSDRPETDLGIGHASEVFAWDGSWWMSRFAGYMAPGPSGPRLESALWFDRLVWDPEPLAAPSLERDPWDGQWTPTVGIAFTHGPAFGENALVRGGDPLGIQGDWFLSTLERYRGPLDQNLPGDHDETGLATGRIRSRGFVLRHPRLRLRVGGDQDPEGLWVRLRSAADDRVLAWTTGPGTPELVEVVWDVRDWRGQEVYLEVVDASPVGGISLDFVRGSHDSDEPRSFPLSR